MKKNFLLFLFAIATISMAAQNIGTALDTTKQNPQKTFNCIIDKKPMFPGGETALIEFLKKNLKYPNVAMKYGIEGRVIMTFIIDKEGNVKDIKTAKNGVKITNLKESKLATLLIDDQEKIKKQIALAFAKEAARVIRIMPKWTPGEMLRGGKWEPVRVKYTLPVSFRL
jgi:protein TonB